MINKTREVIATIKHGSHLYGLNTAESDTDYKSIVLPSEYDILNGNTHFSTSESTGDPEGKNGAGDTDTEVFSLQKFLKLAIGGEMVVMDMLHCKPDDVVACGRPDIWLWLVNIREKFYTKNLQDYVAYARKQAAKYGVRGSRLNTIQDALVVIDAACSEDNNQKFGTIFDKMPINEYSKLWTDDANNHFFEIVGRKLQCTIPVKTARAVLGRIYDQYGHRAKLAASNEGIDWKAISHVLRGGYQARAIFSTGTFAYPLVETSYIKAVKAGELDYITQVQPTLEALMEELIVLSENSDLPEEVDAGVMNDELMNIHRDIIIAGVES